MNSQNGVAPDQAEDTAGFIALMRQLKDETGLTYRQLEERATEQGMVLARSTLADVLNGRSLPRPELLSAFVRPAARRTGRRTGSGPGTRSPSRRPPPWCRHRRAAGYPGCRWSPRSPWPPPWRSGP
ncbi:helix-turn-helix domain-containing protein [Kitasatospora gansuensis]